MDWTINNRPVTDDDVRGFTGFVYIVRDTLTDRYYVGQKTLTSKRLQPLRKGATKRKRTTVESDWRKYYGSSLELCADIKANGRDRYSREIIHLCRSKGEMNYLELREQIVRDVLLDANAYNSFVGGKIHRKHVGSLQKV